MSWVQSAVSCPSDDVFDEDANEMDLAQKEWKNTMQERVKEGYVEGIEAGKAMTLQQGFNQGYKESVRTMFLCGQLKGTLSALSSWCHCRGCSSTVQNELSDLLNQLQKYEEYLLTELNQTPSQPNVGDLMDIIEDMDLGHQDSGAKDLNICENDNECSGHCRTNSGTGSSQSECCRRGGEGIYSTRATFGCIKEKTATLVAQLGLSPDTIEHIQLLQT